MNHPNIGGIYGLEEANGITALVMELVEGEDSRERIARGAIPLDEALPIAKQIAEALEAAHEQGIIHRDLKPANIKAAPRRHREGARLRLGEGDGTECIGGADAVAVTDDYVTRDDRDGVILGTAAYMRPEQARGKAVDKRSDIWAFGCVLYEMLTGKRAFAGDEVADTLAKVLDAHPDWLALGVALPLRVRELLHRCLEKDARRRLRDIGDALADLQDVATRVEYRATGSTPDPACAGGEWRGRANYPVARACRRWRRRLAYHRTT